jgi:bacterioferritin
MPQFVENVEEIRKRAMQKIDEGPVTSTYELDKKKSIGLMNEALATEIVCVLRYMHHYLMSTGIHAVSIRDTFKEHADDERDHADRIADRIQELGGVPDFNPGTLVQRSATQYVKGENLAEMIREDLIAERIVIDVYRDLIRFFGEKDPTTRVIFEEILKDEEEHANDLTDLLFIANPSTGATEGEDPGTELYRRAA